MRIFYMTLLALVCSKIGTAQLVISGTSSATSVANNAPAIFVDPTLTITGSGTITSALVSVATNFNSGDVLSYTGSLPSGVSGTYNAATGVLTFSGSASGKRYNLITNASLWTNGTFNSFPGNAAGTTATGGQVA